MAKYSIQDTTLTAIGDAIRDKSGKHTRVEYGPYIELVPSITVSKTPNATGFDSHEGGFSNKTLYDVVRIPGASSIYVDIAVEVYLWSGSDNVEIVAGEYDASNFPTGAGEKIYSKDMNNKLIRKQITISNTDVITFKFTTGASHNYLGYYAECSGIDADGQPMGDTYVEREGEHEVKNTLTPAQMAIEIEEFKLYDPPAEAFEWSGDLSYKLRNGHWDWFVNDFGDRITTKNVNQLSYFASGAQSIIRFPFDINITNTISSISQCFNNCYELTEAPRLVGKLTNGKKVDIDYLFNGCRMLKEIPNDYFYIFGGIEYWESVQQLTSGSRSSIFGSCYSLRKLPDISMLKTKVAYYSCLYYAMCQNCYSLEGIENLPVLEVALTSNVLNNTVMACYRLKRFTFETNEDGTPKTAELKNQSFELSSNAGWVYSTSRDSFINKYGNSVKKEIVDDATYQALKDDPDSWTMNMNYSRYNKLSALETINSLPDTSAYLASAGGTNTIKFRGAAGALTDGGAINTLTEEEIAVAAAKGWTVSFI